MACQNCYRVYAAAILSRAEETLLVSRNAIVRPTSRPSVPAKPFARPLADIPHSRSFSSSEFRGRGENWEKFASPNPYKADHNPAKGRSARKEEAKDSHFKKDKLQSYGDPKKVAERVETLLKSGGLNVDKAIEFTRTTSSHCNNVVAWNHIIWNRMEKGEIPMALKLYNEMKKRGIDPDEYTYLRILDGIAMNYQYNYTSSTALSTALTIYYGMADPSSKVQPSILHTNAALKVCARAKDLDSMWAVAEKIPEAGPRAADTVTYTTLLNGIRLVWEGGPENALNEAKDLWQGVMTRWQDGLIYIDEQLACAFGRNLLRSPNPKDWDDVLSLAQRLFNVPRLVPRMEARMKQIFRPSRARKALSGTVGRTTAELYESGSQELKNPLQLYAKPGANFLSMVMEACLLLRSYEVGLNYYKLVAGIPGVEPDLDCHLQYLRLCSQLGRSNDCVVHIKEMIAKKMDIPPNAIRISMAACNKNFSQGFSDSLQLFEIIQEQKMNVKANALTVFIKIAGRNRDPVQMKQAWSMLAPPYVNLRDILAEEKLTPQKRTWNIELCHSMVELCDSLLHRHDTSWEDGELKSMQNHRTKLRAYIEAAEVEQLQPKVKTEEPNDLDDEDGATVSAVQDFQPRLSVQREPRLSWKSLSIKSSAIGDVNLQDEDFIQAAQSTRTEKIFRKWRNPKRGDPKFDFNEYKHENRSNTGLPKLAGGGAPTKWIARPKSQRAMERAANHARERQFK